MVGFSCVPRTEPDSPDWILVCHISMMGWQCAWILSMFGFTVGCFPGLSDRLRLAKLTSHPEAADSQPVVLNEQLHQWPVLYCLPVKWFNQNMAKVNIQRLLYREVLPEGSSRSRMPFSCSAKPANQTMKAEKKRSQNYKTLTLGQCLLWFSKVFLCQESFGGLIPLQCFHFWLFLGARCCSGECSRSAASSWGLSEISVAEACWSLSCVFLVALLNTSYQYFSCNKGLQTFPEFSTDRRRWKVWSHECQVATARRSAAAGQPCSPRKHMGAQLLRGPRAYGVQWRQVIRIFQRSDDPHQGEGWKYGGEYKDLMWLEWMTMEPVICSNSVQDLDMFFFLILSYA